MNLLQFFTGSKKNDRDDELKQTVSTFLLFSCFNNTRPQAPGPRLIPCLSAVSFTHNVKWKKTMKPSFYFFVFFKAHQTWQFRHHKHRRESGRPGGLPRADLTRDGMALIFPGHTTNGTQIKSLLFTVTFPFPSFLREIFPPSAAISLTGYPLQNKRPSSGVTQSQYGRLRVRTRCTVASVLLLFRNQTCRGRNTPRGGTCWLITTVQGLVYFKVNMDHLHWLLPNSASVRFFLWKLHILISMFGLLFLGSCHRLGTIGAQSSSPCGDESLCDTNLIEFQSPSLTQTLVIITFSMWTWPLTHNTSGLSADMEPVLSLIFLHFPTPLWLPGGCNSPLHVKRLREVKYSTCEQANRAKIFSEYPA